MTARKPTRRGGRVLIGDRDVTDVPPKDRAHIIAQLRIATKWAGGWVADVPHFRLAVRALRLAAKRPPRGTAHQTKVTQAKRGRG